MLRALLGLLVALAVLAGLHAYLWWRLVGTTTRRGSRVRLAGTVAVPLLGVLAVGAVAGRGLPRPVATPIAWVGFTWIAVAFYLLLVLVALEPVRVLLARRGARRTDPARRLVLARGLAAVAGTAAAGTVGYGAAVVAAGARVVAVEVRLRRLDPRGDGLRVALLSDVHISPLVRRPFLAEVVAQVNGLRPDVVAIVGDLVDGTVAELGGEAEPLRDLRPVDGTFFVTGNHEYFSGPEEWVRHLPSLGVRVLRNERVVIERDGVAVLDLAGVDDVTAAGSGVPGHGTDLDAALAGRDPARPVVLLAHQPVLVDQAAARGVDLQLSGHTHGGQIVPYSLLVRLAQPFLAGLHRVRDTQVYVTRGTGTYGPRVRVGAPPEITLLTLRAERAG